MSRAPCGVLGSRCRRRRGRWRRGRSIPRRMGASGRRYRHRIEWDIDASRSFRQEGRITAEQRAQLESWSRRRSAHRRWRCARATVGHSAHGRQVAAALLARRPMKSRPDEPRPGTPRKRSDRQAELVLTRTLESQPKLPRTAHTRHGKACSLGQSTVSHIWRALSLAPIAQRPSSSRAIHCFSTRCATSSAWIPNPPDRALVLCADEKAQIQDTSARSRRAPVVDAPRPDRTPHP
jgi:hypothetical protein